MLEKSNKILSNIRESKKVAQSQVLWIQGMEKEIRARIKEENAQKALEEAKVQTAAAQEPQAVPKKEDVVTADMEKKAPEPTKVEKPKKAKPEVEKVEAKEPKTNAPKAKEEPKVKEPKAKEPKAAKEATPEKKAPVKEKEPVATKEEPKKVEPPKAKKPEPVKVKGRRPIGIRVVHRPTPEEKRLAEKKEAEAKAARAERRNNPQGAQGRGNYNRDARPQGGRPQGGRPQGGRPQGGRPQGGRPQGGRPQGGRPQGGRPQGGRPQGGPGRPQQGAARGPRAQGIDRNIKKELAPTVKKESSSNFSNRRKDKPKAYNPNDARKRKSTPQGGRRKSGQQLVYGDVYVPTGSRKRGNKRIKSKNIERIVIEHAVITTETMTVKELAEKIGRPGAEIIKQLMILGIMATINQTIDFDSASLVAAEFGVTLEQKLEKSNEELMMDIHEDVATDESAIIRPPIVTVMGHVDHGKTSILDAIRNANVLDTEAGGITQHIGAYTIKHEGSPITFIDTPGHEAFTAMRARGAQVTDIAILVVAADDGVMPQTVEAINHAKAAEVPIIVAINKMDKPAANPDRVKQELTEYELVTEEWGGDTIMVPVSAITQQGIAQLLENILLVSEMQELKASPDAKAHGTIIESRLEVGRGPVATVLVGNGTLHVGDAIVAGTSSGRVRAMVNDKGERVDEAGPSTPVEVVGFSDVPAAGDALYVADDKLSRKVAQDRRDRIREEKMKSPAMTLDELFGRINEGKIKDLNIIIKSDVQGSAEALRQSLEKLSNDEVRVKCIHVAAGGITESDVLLAATSNAIIIGFNVRPDNMGRAAAERENVEVRTYRIIYNAIEDVEKAMKGLLEPVFEEIIDGHAEVRNVFKITGVGAIAGSYVTDGTIKRNSMARVMRDSVVIYEGKISSLKRFKDDAKEVATGYECGIGVENFNDIKDGDVIEAYRMQEIER